MDNSRLMDLVSEIEKAEKENPNVPLIFTEVLKDEINANNEVRMYNGMKRLIKKYSEDSKSTAILNEVTRVMSGGTSLSDSLSVSIDEALHPTLVARDKE